MGQGQSQQQKPGLQNRKPTPEPLDPEEAARLREQEERLRNEVSYGVHFLRYLASGRPSLSKYMSQPASFPLSNRQDI